MTNLERRLDLGVTASEMLRAKKKDGSINWVLAIILARRRTALLNLTRALMWNYWRF